MQRECSSRSQCLGESDSQISAKTPMVLLRGNLRDSPQWAQVCPVQVDDSLNVGADMAIRYSVEVETEQVVLNVSPLCVDGAGLTFEPRRNNSVRGVLVIA